MGLTPVAIEEFPGLDLREDPGPGSRRGAIDLLNVTLDNGAVRTRDGASLFYTGAVSPIKFLSTFSASAGQQLIASNFAGACWAVDAGGTLLASSTISNPLSTSGVALGTPTNNFFYMASSAGVVKRWDGATWTSPAGMPANSTVVSISPADNRLAIADSGSKLWFSDPGAPETFGANNFVQLTPGDGELIGAMCVYNNQLYVFKDTKFFVFYGNSTDSTGNPVFNYRTVNTGIGLRTSAGAGSRGAHCYCVGPHGVYFHGSYGIYVTTGGAPTLMSQPITPFFTGRATAYWQGGTTVGQPLTDTPLDMAWVDDSLYVSYSPSAVMVFNSQYGTWASWSVAGGANAMCGIKAASTNTMANALAIGTTGGLILRTTAGATTDNGTAIVSRYRLPFENYGSPGEKRLRETIVEGVGAPTVQWSRDWGSLVTGSAVQLGTSPAIGYGRQRLAIRGRAFSLQLGASSGAWQVNRVQANVAGLPRQPEVTA